MDPALTASRAMVGVIARSLAGIADTVSLPQFRVLVLLASQGPSRMGDLAHRLGLHQSSFSRTADRMEAAGLITRRPSPGSRREVLIEATDEGLKHVDDVTEARRRDIAAIMERLTAAEQAQVAAGFELFARAADEPSVADGLLLGL